MRTAIHAGVAVTAIILATPAVACEDEENFADPRGNVEIRFVSSDGEMSVYELRSKSSSCIWYYHWTTLGPESASYCRRKDASVYMCSEQIVLTGDDANGYEPWMHEIKLSPMQSVQFKVKGSEVTDVGVMFPLPDGGDDLIIWSNAS